MPVNRDFRDLFSAFSAADVRFLVVGARSELRSKGLRSRILCIREAR